jgi:hypothetical protein
MLAVPGVSEVAAEASMTPFGIGGSTGFTSVSQGGMMTLDLASSAACEAF